MWPDYEDLNGYDGAELINMGSKRCSTNIAKEERIKQPRGLIKLLRHYQIISK